MTELEKGPRGLRRGRGARERILKASRELFRDQGINSTGMDQLCAAAEVSKRTLYQHFAGKDELVAEHLRQFDPNVLPEVFDRADLSPRERLLTVFDIHAPLCPFIRAAVELHDPNHPARKTPASTSRPSLRGSPRPPARPAPPTPSNSASSLRCCWMAPRPAAEFSTPRRSPPPPPSQPSSSTTPSQPQRSWPMQATTRRRGRMQGPGDELSQRRRRKRTRSSAAAGLRERRARWAEA